MKKILLICRGSSKEKTISSDLEQDGHDVELIGAEDADIFTMCRRKA